MKKKIAIILGSILICSVPSFSRTIHVVEVGANVYFNKLSQIKEASQFIKVLEHYKQEIDHYRFQVQNMNKHIADLTSVALEDTLGISKQDIKNIIKLKELSGELYRDVNDFDRKFYKKINFESSKLTDKDLVKADTTIRNDMAKKEKEIMEFKAEQKAKLEQLQVMMRNFDKMSKDADGEKSVIQATNQINSEIYKSLNELTLYLKNKEADEMAMKKQQEKLNDIELERELRKSKQEFLEKQRANNKAVVDRVRYINTKSITM